MKEDSKPIPHNQKSMNLTLISQRNRRLNRGDSFENRNREITENKKKINSNSKYKLKLNAKQR